MDVRNVMSTDVASIETRDTLQAAAAKMAEINVGSLPVLRDGRLAGIVTDRDIVVRAIARGDAPDTAVADAMSEGVVTLTPDMSVDEAAHLMSDKQIRRLYVVDEDRLVGVVSLGDLAVDAETEEAGETLREISKD
ncbi:CBS domain-containing protein [Allosphingosinicella humi]